MNLQELIKTIEQFIEENKLNEDIRSQINTLICSLILIKQAEVKMVDKESDEIEPIDPEDNAFDEEDSDE